MDEIEKQIETLIMELPVSEMKEIIDIPDITRCEIELHPQRLIGPRKEKILREVYPISQRWVMTHTVGAVAHFWQLDDLPNGNYRWADDPIVDISDIWIQIYQNGWIIIVRSAQDVRGIYDPERVAKIGTLKKEMAERDAEQINARIAWAAADWVAVFPDLKAFDRKIVDVAKEAMRIAEKTGQKPFDTCEEACEAVSGNKEFDAYQFRSFLMSREVSKEYAKQTEQAVSA